MRKDQRGIAPLMIILGILVIVVIGAAAYFVIDNSKDSNNSANIEASKAGAAQCTKEIDDKEFCKFVSNWSYGKEQRMVITAGDEVTTMEIDSSGNTSMTSVSNGTETYAFISMGNNTFMKNIKDGTWTKYTQEPTDNTRNTIDEVESEFDFESEATKNTSKITPEGKEACGTNICFKYLVTDTEVLGKETRVWFDDKEYKLRKMTSTSAEGSTEFIVSYEVKEISEPSPIVEAPNFENMTAEELQQYMQQYAE